MAGNVLVCVVRERERERRGGGGRGGVALLKLREVPVSLCEPIFRLILNYTLALEGQVVWFPANPVVVPVVTHRLLICFAYLITGEGGKSF